MMRWLWLVFCWWIGFSSLDAQPADLPSKPTRYVSDRAFVLDEATVAALDTRLADFERETSNQVVVAIFASLPVGAELAQYSTQVFRAWDVGQAEKDNGVVLFIYKNDRKLFIATGRGMEGALPDVTCKSIIENEIVPKFKAEDFAGGVSAGVESILAATKGEYKGTGKTVGEGEGSQSEGFPWWFIIFFVVAFLTIRKLALGQQKDVVLNRRGYNTFGGGWLSGGSSNSGSSWGGGGGGGFSGGGGSSGGGGAGGSW